LVRALHFFVQAQNGDQLAQLGSLIFELLPQPPHLGRQQPVIFFSD
jgi:hypothetical protein